MTDILVVCPANCVTGGPECLHAFVHELNKIRRVRARIWYWDIKNYPPMPAQYESYGCEYVTDLPEGFDGTIIVPEIWANRVMEFKQCQRVIYWLGLDAYAGWTPQDERGAFLKDEEILHIVQSDYAHELLSQLGVKRMVRCTDYVNAEFYEDYQEEERSDVILFNPAKATPFMHRLMDECYGFQFKAIKNMTRQQVIDTMRHSKLYIDFGEFPGRERMPREAVLCGCCIITSNIGAAAHSWDFLHSYKFESKDSHIWAIKYKMKYVLEHYEECRKDFNMFREYMKKEKETQIMTQVMEVAHEIQHYNSGT